jgi:hypothetical protein
MKLILIFFVVLNSTLAMADSFSLDKDGKHYVCEEKNPVIDPGGILLCIDTAYRGPFSKEEATRICTGSRTVSPANCAIKAYNGPFAKEEAIQLCIRASGNGPIDCALKAYSGPFSREESLKLCAGGDVANAECAIKAYAGPYSKEEALRLCTTQPLLILKSLRLIEQSTEIQQKLKLIQK